MPCLIEARSEASSIVLNDYLYVFGGMTHMDQSQNLQPLKNIERLNLKTTSSKSVYLKTF